MEVKEGDMIIAPINQLAKEIRAAGGLVVLSRDWHPKDHSSFREFGGPWLPHCVEDTPGAEFHPDLYIDQKEDWIISKATDREFNNFSAFQSNNLATKLRQRGIKTIYITGLATEYCVKTTTLDALKEKFKVYLLIDAIGAVNLHPDDGQKAIDEMEAAGAILMKIQKLY